MGLVTSLMGSFSVRAWIGTYHGPPSSTKSIKELEFSTNNKGDLPIVGSKLDHAPLDLGIPSGM